MDPYAWFAPAPLDPSAEHRWRLEPTAGARGAYVALLPLESVEVGRSTFRLGDGTMCLHVSRRSAVLRDTMQGFVECTSLRDAQPPLRVLSGFGWHPLRKGEATRLYDGDMVELARDLVTFVVRDLQRHAAPLVAPVMLRTDTLPPPASSTQPEDDWVRRLGDGNDEEYVRALLNQHGCGAAAGDEVDALTSLAAFGDDDAPRPLASTTASSSSGWIRRRSKASPSLSASLLQSAPSTLSLSYEGSTVAKKAKVDNEEAEDGGVVGDEPSHDDLSMMTATWLVHRCAHKPHDVGFVVAPMTLLRVMDTEAVRAIAGHSVVLTHPGRMECTDLGLFDGALAFRAQQCLRASLACTFSATALADPETRVVTVALGIHSCAGPLSDEMRLAVSRIMGARFPLRATLRDCQMERELRQRDEANSAVVFRATESEKMLTQALSSLANATLPAAGQPRLVRTPLKHHQLQGLGWMLRRELAVEALPPFWSRIEHFGPLPWSPATSPMWGREHSATAFAFCCVLHRLFRGHVPQPLRRYIVPLIIGRVPIRTEYHHQLTARTTSVPPRPSRGGILADDMGVGKTLQVISLIACNSGVPLAAHSDVGVYNDAIYVGLLRDNSSEEAPSTAPDPSVHLNLSAPGEPNRRPTLIVCPLSVISNWESQIEAHLGPNVLRVLVFHGRHKQVATKASLEAFDVVITTYGTMAPEFADAAEQSAAKKATSDALEPDLGEDHGVAAGDDAQPVRAAEARARSVLRSVRWRRVVLDEAHYIRNGRTKSARAVMNIDAWFRWALTGTPLCNRVDDLRPLLEFIREPVFADGGAFRQLLRDPIMQGLAEGFIRLRTLMLSSCLRRCKDSADASGKPIVELPPKHIVVRHLALDEEEAFQYQQLDSKCAEFYQLLSVQGAALMGKAHSFLLLLLLRLRQTCDHTVLCGDLEAVLGRAKLLIEGGEEFDPKKLTARFDNAELTQDGCSVCAGRLGSMFVHAVCFHVFCETHRDEAVEFGQCPICSEIVDGSEIHQGPACTNSRRERMRLTGNNRPSSKMKEVLRIVKEVQANGGPRAKTVVFSQWTSFLDLLEDMVQGAGLRCVRIDGTMSASERLVAMRAFNSTNAGSPTVMLASLMAAGVGINLLGGCNIVMSDVWWSPAVEDQAIDRVHRIGQTQPVSVYRLIVANSVEERMTQLHDAKRALAGTALMLRSPEELKLFKREYLARLFVAGRSDMRVDPHLIAK